MKETGSVLIILLTVSVLTAADVSKVDYLVLATSKTSTMEKEMNEAADAGYSFVDVMGGGTSFGGNEAVVVMMKNPESNASAKRKFKLLATSKTSTMQKELQQVGDEGWEYRGQTVFESAFGGREVTVILERNPDMASQRIEYKLLSTSKTSTMQKELRQAGEAGFRLAGLGVGKTAFGGSEVICILRRAGQ